MSQLTNALGFSIAMLDNKVGFNDKLIIMKCPEFVDK